MVGELELEPGQLTDLASDGAAAFPILRVTGAAPAMTLVGAGNAMLAPGAYLIEVRVRAIEGALNVGLRVGLAGGGGVEPAASEVSPGVWRGAFTIARTADALTAQFTGASALIFAGARVITETDQPADAPTLRAAMLTGARALFRKLPNGLRRALLSSDKRGAWLAKTRGGAEPVAARNGGAFVTGGDASALRADFDNRLAVARGLKDAAYVAQREGAAPVNSDGVKLIAFHLPQFHVIPENDAWWGRGFTEWSNVSKATPQFLGHYQPRLPGELGFYDLTTPGVLRRQATLARAHGVSAFCFHYYWFAGKRLLEAPLDAVVADRSIDIEFCLCWANENWTRRWDGAEHEVLIGQDHSTEDHARVFDDLARYMDDPRYVRIDGKPVLVIYRPAIINNAREMTDLWRKAAAQQGWPGIYLIATNAFQFDDAKALGFDALVEFPPHGLVADRVEGAQRWLNPRHSGAVYDYAAVARDETRRAHSSTSFPTFPGVMPGWDNEARRPGAGTVYHGATPAAYGAWLAAAVARASRTLPTDRRFVFINAWNEWAEGAYLEPDRAFGRAYLAETARVLSGSRP